MDRFIYVLSVWISILASLGSVCGELKLTPKATVVDEDSPVTLTCTSTRNVNVTLFTWYQVFRETDYWDMDHVAPSTCHHRAGSINLSEYSFSCAKNNREMSWTIKNNDRSNNGDRWMCRVVDSIGAVYSNKANISVKVPITSVTMILPTSNATLDVPENTEQRFRCRTDGGLPIADITWYKDNATPGDTSDDTCIKIQQNITVTNTTVKDVDIRTSTLVLYPSELDEGNRIYCTAKNSDSQTPLISKRKPLLNILYAPWVPTELGPVSSLIQSTEATVQWTPGFNSGTSQTFVLMYKTSSEMEWKIIDVVETGDAIMKHTFTNLEPNTTYIVKMYARNRGGNSSFTDHIIFQTLEMVDPPSPEPHSSWYVGMMVGGIVGGLVAVILVVIVVIFLLRKHRTTTGQGTYNQQTNDRDETNVVQGDSSNKTIGRDSKYETLNEKTRDLETYSTLQTETGERNATMADEKNRNIPSYLTLQPDNDDRTASMPDQTNRNIPLYLELQPDNDDRTASMPDQTNRNIPSYLELQPDNDSRTASMPDQTNRDIPPYLNLQPDDDDPPGSEYEDMSGPNE